MDTSHSAALIRLLFDKSNVRLEDSMFSGKKVLVTGAGGSIGGALVKRLVAVPGISLVLLDQSELGLYQTHKAIGDAPWAIPLVCDVRDQASLKGAFKYAKPNLVLHAAALKHVPMLEVEHNVFEAVNTNVRGTLNVAIACEQGGVEQMVSISTDKAVNPSSILGLTKRIAELAICNEARQANTEFSVVRFGNVINSSGSAVPLFKEQIARGGPVTVTDFRMTRYMMTLADAANLVLASTLLPGTAELGDLYVLEMGEPVRILDLAHMLIRLADMEPNLDIPVIETGIRPGERLQEELFYASEKPCRTALKGVQHGQLPEPSQEVSVLLYYLLRSQQERHMPTLVDGMKKLVPEYNGTWGA